MGAQLKRHWKLIAGAVIVLAVAAYLVAGRLLDDSTTPESVSDALHRFRSNTSTRSEQDPGLPAVGVYLYRTEGSEQISTSIFGGIHQYPRSSTLTVESVPCGISERWQSLITRWSETETCQGGGGLRISAVREQHEFFGTESSVAYRCLPARMPLPRQYHGGQSWRIECRGGEGELELDSEVVSERTMMVGATSIPAVEIRAAVSMRGGLSGTSVAREWRSRDDGLLLRRNISVAASGSAVDGGTYAEHYSIALTKVSPRR